MISQIGSTVFNGIVSDFGGVGRAYARPTPPKSDFFQLFRELLILQMSQDLSTNDSVSKTSEALLKD